MILDDKPANKKNPPSSGKLGGFWKFWIGYGNSK
jgi:hypothetical protein